MKSDDSLSKLNSPLSKMDRRKFLSLGSAALVGLSLKSERRIAGSFVNESFQAGHLLRDRASFSAPKRVEKSQVVIVGGGIAGLSAAWRLRKRGFSDFVLLEMNDAAGGNARWAAWNVCMAMPICFKLFRHWARRAASPGYRTATAVPGAAAPAEIAWMNLPRPIAGGMTVQVKDWLLDNPPSKAVAVTG